MKRKILMLMALLAGALAFHGCDDNDEKRIGYADLPQTAREFISEHFPDRKVNHVEQDTDNGRKDYEVVLDNGTELSFDASGVWQSVDCKFSTLPEGILPVRIAAHIAENYPQAAAYKIEEARTRSDGDVTAVRVSLSGTEGETFPYVS